MKIYKCFKCGKRKFGENKGKYIEIEYPNKKQDGNVLAIKFVCNECFLSDREGYLIEKLKRDENITLYDLERLGLIKNLKGKICY